jgi:hypothetical protein
MKLMSAKFPGVCIACRGRIAVGAQIVWAAGVGARHFGKCPEALAMAFVPAATVPEVRVEGAGILALLGKAKAHLKYPKVRFAAPNGGELRLAATGATSKYPGAVNIYVNRDWTGRINVDGSVTANASHLVSTLQAIAADPAKAASQYGALTGRCSFCNLTLTDEGSVEVGYGPVCAAHYGLPHTPKGTKTVYQPV